MVLLQRFPNFRQAIVAVIDALDRGSAPGCMRKQGLRPFVVGALAELFITAVTLGLVVGAAAVFRL